MYLDSQEKIRSHRGHSKDKPGVISNFAFRGLMGEPAGDARLPGDGAPQSDDLLLREDGDREEIGTGCAWRD